MSEKHSYEIPSKPHKPNSIQNITLSNKNNINNIETLKKKYIILQDNKSVLISKLFPDSKLNELRLHIQKATNDNYFLFLDYHNIPILKEHESVICIEDISMKDEIINIISESSELAAPDGQKLFILALFLIIFVFLVLMVIYNPDYFKVLYISCIGLGLSFCKYII